MDCTLPQNICHPALATVCCCCHARGSTQTFWLPYLSSFDALCWEDASPDDLCWEDAYLNVCTDCEAKIYQAMDDIAYPLCDNCFASDNEDQLCADCTDGIGRLIVAPDDHSALHQLLHAQA